MLQKFTSLYTHAARARTRKGGLPGITGAVAQVGFGVVKDDQEADNNFVFSTISNLCRNH